jgi:DNA-binding XRE family transcriptional regulator
VAETFPALTVDLWTGPGRPGEADRVVASWTRNALMRAGYEKTEALTGATPADLADIRMFGAACLAETQRVLKAHGLALAGEPRPVTGDVRDCFAASLRRLRGDAGWTRTRLAGKAGVSIDTVCKIEAGKTGPSLHVADALARALGTTVTAMTGPGG